MLYYQKNGMIFYKLDQINKSYVEIFNNGSTQFRLVEIKNENLYNQIIQKIEDFEYSVTTEENFNQVLSLTKSKF